MQNIFCFCIFALLSFINFFFTIFYFLKILKFFRSFYTLTTCSLRLPNHSKSFLFKEFFSLEPKFFFLSKYSISSFSCFKNINIYNRWGGGLSGRVCYECMFFYVLPYCAALLKICSARKIVY